MKNFGFKNITLEFLLSNTTSFIQPLVMGIIKSEMQSKNSKFYFREDRKKTFLFVYDFKPNVRENNHTSNLLICIGQLSKS